MVISWVFQCGQAELGPRETYVVFAHIKGVLHPYETDGLSNSHNSHNQLVKGAATLPSSVSPTRHSSVFLVVVMPGIAIATGQQWAAVPGAATIECTELCLVNNKVP